MAKLFNRVRVATATTGTGTITVGAATSNAFLTFAEAGVADGNVVSYVIEDGDDFEAGIGTYTVSGTTLSRDTVRVSKITGTVGTSKISLSGSAIVFIDALAEDLFSRQSDSFNSFPSVLTVSGNVNDVWLTRFGAFGNNAFSTIHQFTKTRHASDPDGHVALVDGDPVGEIRSWGSDGDQFIQLGRLRWEVDGTVGNDFVPGRLVIASGVSAVETFRINSSGNVGIADATTARRLSVRNDNAATNTVTTVARLWSSSSGTPAAGIGSALEFVVETATDNHEIGAVLKAVATDVTSTSEDFDVVLDAMVAGAAASERIRWNSLLQTIIPTGGEIVIPDNASETDFTIRNASFGSVGISINTNGAVNIGGDGSGVTLQVSDKLDIWKGIIEFRAANTQTQSRWHQVGVNNTSGIIEQRYTTLPQTYRVYFTFTDTSNYQRAALNTDTAYVELAAETAGTGADNIDVRLTPAGTGNVLLDGLAIVTADAGADALLGWDDSAGVYQNLSKADALAALGLVVPAGALFGLTMSNAADAVADITVAAGQAADEGGNIIMVLAAAITKQIDAGWAVGTNAGGLNTGAEAANTWYEVHLIRRPDTGVVDVMFTTTANRATLPANYTQQRRIGWIRNDAGSNILAFTHVDNYFTLTTQINDVAASVTVTAAQVTLTVPPNTIARFRAAVESTTAVNANAGIVFSEVAEGNVTPAITTGIASLGQWDLATGASAGHFELRVNASSQIEHDAQVGAGTFDISTFGWVDHRRKLSPI